MAKSNENNNINKISSKEKEILFNQTKILLGYPQREVEISDDALEVLLNVSIEEYSSFINDWLIQNQWSTLQNTHTNTADLLFNLTTKTLDFEKSFTYAYSRQAGVGTNGLWELKRDCVVISGGTQVYTIPAGREVNEVLWVTPPQVGTASIGNLSPVGWTSTAFGWNVGGIGASAVLPAFNMYLFAQNMKMQKDIIQSELTYRITGGQKGTKNLYLYPIPGSSDEITGRFGKHLDGSLVWYFYYDADEHMRDQCLEENNDIIKLPNDVPINSIPYQKLNSSSKAKVRRLLIAECKNYLAQTRGKFSGKLKGRDGQEMTADYSYLLEQYKEEKKNIYDELRLFLDLLTYRKLMEDKASISENVNIVMKNTPSGQNIFMI